MKKSILVIFSLIIMISILLSGCGDNEGMAGSVFDDAPEGTVAVVEADEETNYYQTFEEAFNAANENTDKEVTVTLLEDVSVGSQISPSQRSKALTLDLGGFTIDRGLFESTSDGSVFSFTASGDFTVKNGTVTGGNTSSAGGGIYAGTDNVNLILEDLTVSENHSEQQGGGIYLDKNKMDVNLNNVIIKDNTSGGYGGGIYLSKYWENNGKVLSVHFSGLTQIDQNEGRDGRNNFTIGLNLSQDGMVINCNMDFSKLISGANIKFAYEGFNQGSILGADRESFKFIHEDSPNQMIEVYLDTVYILNKHEHKYECSVSEGFQNTLFLSCSEEGCLFNGVYAGISNSTFIADGTPKHITINGDVPGIDNLEDYVSYTKKGDTVPLGSAPSEPGEYTATLSLFGVSVSADLEIKESQESHIHDGIEYLPITSEYYISAEASKVISLTSGHYYLIEDLIGCNFWIDGDVVICCNGYVISNNNPMFPLGVEEGKSLTIMDCNKERRHYYSVSEAKSNDGEETKTNWTPIEASSDAVDIKTLKSEPAAGMKVFVSGGGICNSSYYFLNCNKLTLTGINYIKNTGIFSCGGDELVTPDEGLFITDCSFLFNQNVYGGAINSCTRLEIRNSDFIGNACTRRGGAVNSDVDTVIEGCKFYNNESGDKGGALCLNGNAEINNCDIQLNYAEYDGGGIYCMGNLDIKNTSIIGNTSQLCGGGIEVSIALNRNLNIEKCTISDNISTTGGGIATGFNTHIKDSVIKTNKALFGAGIASAYINLSIEDSEITNNRMFSSEEISTLFPSLANEKFNFKSDYAGEGIYLSSGTVTLAGKVIIDNNRIDNTANNDNLFIENKDRTDSAVIIGSSGLTSGSMIGISLREEPKSGSKTKLSDNGDYSVYFASDASGYKIGKMNNALYLADENIVMDSDAYNRYDLKIKNYKTGKVETVKINHGGILWVDPSVGEWEGSSEPQDITVYKSMTISDPVYEGCYFKGWKISVLDKDLVSIEAQWQY